MIFIGAEEIISPLGDGIESNWKALTENRSGIAAVPSAGFDKSTLYLSRIPGLIVCNKFQTLIYTIIKRLQTRMDPAIIQSEKTLLLISSTKGALDPHTTDPFTETLASLQRIFQLVHTPVVISNACISGVLAINTAYQLIKCGKYEHVLVIGCDVISDFIVYGFQSLFAVSDKPCKPFDANRNGITLGEGCGAVLVSASRDVYGEQPAVLLAGAGANDANHISGPSRTGEGLYRSVVKTMKMNNVGEDEVDFISAHGTATVFNDEMESIAFDRLGLSDVPLNSMKGYFGHTLGAAGVIEVCASVKMMQAGTMLKSAGFEESGTSKKLNVVRQNSNALISTMLKTASGFGGGNASLMIRQL
ncbi:beta-ketoacyl synthase N-terminal-like domain-containing protein [Dyadobacter sandarakinus]|uniref:Beta-ketoacyl synthase n=1 Tax=Dyadobacter sandarakinus TaxID=2747268 RepID=A0ABX7I4S5_9BACT|nr:beta-ketoacyl synthase N-terminal-like domain-containing protein [Dyadobacter sandarakinus]QRR00935.1 beta-ketoacyl synthase [Dyadobacter sandarakinus]